MIPIQKLLSRIHWDSAFGNAFFEIEYEDRVTGLVRISLEQISSIDSLSFSINDKQEQTITIPLHRVRNVYRNKDLIWSRLRHD